MVSIQLIHQFICLLYLPVRVSIRVSCSVCFGVFIGSTVFPSTATSFPWLRRHLQRRSNNGKPRFYCSFTMTKRVNHFFKNFTRINGDLLKNRESIQANNTWNSISCRSLWNTLLKDPLASKAAGIRSRNRELVICFNNKRKRTVHQEKNATTRTF